MSFEYQLLSLLSSSSCSSKKCCSIACNSNYFCFPIEGGRVSPRPPPSLPSFHHFQNSRNPPGHCSIILNKTSLPLPSLLPNIALPADQSF